MESQKQATSSAERNSNRLALACIGVVGCATCASILVFGVLVWSLAPQLYRTTTISQAPAPSGTSISILYASPDGTSVTCDSWENACGLQTALAAARPGDEIWVKAGVYKPAPDARLLNASFQLKDGVALYGGFAGTETSRDRRDWQKNITVLSGDLGGDDGTDPNGVVTDTANIVGRNAFHVVTGNGVGSTAVLDGFTITAGYASQTPPNNNGFGGGMFNWGGSPTLNNLVFSGNTAGKGAAYYAGGGMFNIYSSNPILTNVTFIANTAGSGGGMYNHASNPRLMHVSFIRNKALSDGGMTNYMGSSPTLEDVTFSGNAASSNGGGMGNNANTKPILKHVAFEDNSAGEFGGGMNSYQSDPILTDVEFSNNKAGREGGGMNSAKGSKPVLTNVTFVNNSAVINGGGMLNSESIPTLTNVTFSGNSAGQYGGGICDTFSSISKLTNVTFIGNQAPHGSGICNVGGSFTLVNGIVWGNKGAQEEIYSDHITPDVTYTDVEGGFPGVGNLNVYPLYGDLGEYGGPTRVFALQSGSPVIDQGSPSVCPATDQLGLSRPVDGDGNGSALCDMGAYEYRTSK